jgi:hypothetical protein
MSFFSGRRCSEAIVAVTQVSALPPPVQQQEQPHKRDGHNIPEKIARSGCANGHSTGTLSHLIAAANYNSDLPESAVGDLKVGGLQPLAGGFSMGGMQDEGMAVAIGSLQDKRHVGILDQTWLTGAFHGDAEIRASPGERIGRRKERHDERTRTLAEAQPSAVGVRGLRAGEARETQDESARAGLQPHCHHIPIPRMYIG